MELAIITDEISLDLEEALSEGKALGFRKYELRCIDNYKMRVPFFNQGREARLLEEIAKKEIEISALTPGVFKNSLSDRSRLQTELDDILPKTCEMAVRLGAPMIIVFAFLEQKASDRAEVIARLREAGQIAKAFGLQISVENEPGHFCDTGVKTAKIVSEVSMDNVGINWDPGNALGAGEIAYPIGYEAIRPHLFNMHVKDNIPLPNSKWENRLIGDGGMNWLGQLKAVKKDAIIPHLTLETHVFPVLESTRENLRRLRILIETIDDFYKP